MEGSPEHVYSAADFYEMSLFLGTLLPESKDGSAYVELTDNVTVSAGGDHKVVVYYRSFATPLSMFKINLPGPPLYYEVYCRTDSEDPVLELKDSSGNVVEYTRTIEDASVGSNSYLGTVSRVRYTRVPPPATTLTAGLFMAVTSPGEDLLRVYEWAGGMWAQRGSGIHVIHQHREIVGSGATSSNALRNHITVSGDGNVVAIGVVGPNAQQTPIDYAEVVVFAYDGFEWAQRGLNLTGATLTNAFGMSVSLSDDGSTLAVGAPRETGYVAVYDWDDATSAWVQHGTNVTSGFAGSVWFAYDVKITPDGNAFIAGAPYNNDGCASGGCGGAEVYERTATGWSKKGLSLTTTLSQEFFGNVVEINEDATVVAFANQFRNDNKPRTGKVASYDFVGDEWVLRTIYDELHVKGDHLGASISLTADGNRIAIGVPRAAEASPDGVKRGVVKIFDWNTDVATPRWDQLETDPPSGYLTFEDGMFNGEPVSISDGGNVLVVGSRFQNSTNGRVRTFAWNETDKRWYRAGPDLRGLEDAYFSNAVHITGSAAALPLTYSGPRLASTPPPLAYIDSRGAEKTFNFSQYVNAAGPYTPSPLRYSFSVNNHALLSIEASDETTGAVTLKTRNATGDAKLKVRVTALEAKADVTVLEILTDITALQDDDNPLLTKAILDKTGETTLNLTQYFTDADGDLVFEVTVGDPSVATATVSGATLTVTSADGLSATATTLVTVTARDAGGASASDDFTITFVYDASKYLVVLATDGPDGVGFFEVTIAGITKSDYCPGGTTCTDDIVPLSSISDYTSSIEPANNIANAFNGLTSGHGNGASRKSTMTIGKAFEKPLFYLKVPTSFTLPPSDCGDFYYMYHANWGPAQYYLPTNVRLVLSSSLPADVQDATEWTGSGCDMTIQEGIYTS